MIHPDSPAKGLRAEADLFIKLGNLLITHGVAVCLFSAMGESAEVLADDSRGVVFGGGKNV